MVENSKLHFTHHTKKFRHSNQRIVLNNVAIHHTNECNSTFYKLIKLHLSEGNVVQIEIHRVECLIYVKVLPRMSYSDVTSDFQESFYI